MQYASIIIYNWGKYSTISFFPPLWLYFIYLFLGGSLFIFICYVFMMKSLRRKTTVCVVAPSFNHEKT